jgi:hypothetical protein
LLWIEFARVTNLEIGLRLERFQKVIARHGRAIERANHRLQKKKSCYCG